RIRLRRSTSLGREHRPEKIQPCLPVFESSAPGLRPVLGCDRAQRPWPPLRPSLRRSRLPVRRWRPGPRQPLQSGQISSIWITFRIVSFVQTTIALCIGRQGRVASQTGCPPLRSAGGRRFFWAALDKLSDVTYRSSDKTTIFPLWSGLGRTRTAVGRVNGRTL